MNVEKTVKQIIVEVLGLEKTPDELPSDVPFLDMGMQFDSLTGLRIVLDLENRFDLAIRPGDLTREVFSNVNSMVQFVESQLQVKSRGSG